jgi:RHS repeat-associated protein
MMRSILFSLFVLIFCPSLAAQTVVVGSTEGVFNVSDLGGAGYTIPLKVPKGIGSMQPSLVLTYNSQAGNGIMGMGWSMSGGSVISRVSGNIYNDRKANGVALSAEDRFALDGNRLVVTNGNYGAAASMYRTESETFKDIKANGALGSGPLSFTVTDQNGWVYEYGATTNARAFAAGAAEPYMWLLSSITDLDGNYTSYEYFNQPGEEVLLRYISYGANGPALVSPLCRIAYSYENRPDPNFSYLAGGKVAQARRLQSIRTQQLSSNVWYVTHSYNMEYTADVYTHLTKVIEKGLETSAAIEQLPPTEFTYGTAAVPEEDVVVSYGSLSVPYEFASGDYNGDGKADIVQYTRNYNSTNNTYQLYINSGNSFTAVQNGILPNQESSASSMENMPRNAVASFFDYNGDGTDDFSYKSSKIISGSGSSEVRLDDYNIMLSSGTALTALERIVGFYNNDISEGFINFKNTKPFTGDFDGDGKTEILALKGSTVDVGAGNQNFIIGHSYIVPYSTPFGTTLYAPGLKNMPFDAAYVDAGQSKIYVIDYDGDGKNEILSIWRDAAANADHAQVFKLNVTFDANNKPVLGNPAFVLVNDAGYPTLYHHIAVGDFNGDGITDVLTYHSAVGWEIGYGKGNGQMNDIKPAPISGTPNYAGNYRPVLVADYNGDGKSDIFTYSAFVSMPIPPTIYFATGDNAFVAESYPAIGDKINAYIQNYWMADYNGDGGLDFITKKDGNWPLYRFCFHPDENRHLLSQVKTGMGLTTKAAYQPLTRAGVYSPGASWFSYPYIRRTIPLKVVTGINSDDGLSAAGNNTNYTYSGLKYHAQGKGIMGFDKVTTYDAAFDITTEKNFGLNTAYAFPYLQSSTSRKGTTLLSSSSLTYGLFHYGNKRIWSYITASVNTDHITGMLSSVTSSYALPQQQTPIGVTNSAHTGKPVSITTNKGNGLEISTETFTYPDYCDPLGNNPVPAYIYARPKSVLRTVTRQGQPAYSRKQDFSYNTTTGHPTSIVSDPGTANASTKSFVYNNYGNLAGVTLSAAGLTSRTDVTGYDATQRFLTIAYNSAYPNIKTTSVYNDITGNVESTTNPDGLTTSYTYDGLGRVKTESDNNGKMVTTSYAWASGHPYTTSFAQYLVQTVSNTAGTSYAFYDRLGRLSRAATKGFNGQMIFTDDRYNTIGQLARRSNPYFQGTPLQNSIFSYDAYGRMAGQTIPGGNNTTYTYATAGDNYVTTATNAAGQDKKTFTDKSGQLSRTEDEGGTLDYTYHSNGAIKSTTLNGSALVLQTQYDAYGRKIKSTDPNYGSYQYAYNAFDEQVSQTDPKGVIYKYSYNESGALKTRTGPEGIYNYTYSTAPGPNCGKLVQLTAMGSTINYKYGMGDKINMEERISGTEVFTTQYSYDNCGRLKSMVYPNNKAIEYTYNANDGSYAAIGLPGAVYSTPMGTLPAFLYAVLDRNAFGHVTWAGRQSRYNSGPAGTIPFAFSSTQQYDTYGYLQQLKTATQSSNTAPAITLSHYQYTFQPATGNLLQRRDLKYNLQEDFTYDDVNRLTVMQGQSTGTAPAMFPQQKVDYTASGNGNIWKKSDAGTFAYDQANRVSEINPYINIPASTQDLAYTPFNKVSSITQSDGKGATFAYWPDQERSRTGFIVYGSLKKTKSYAPCFEKEKDESTGSIRELCYVYGPEGNLVNILERKDGVDKVYYILTDHLGSITQVLDAGGAIVEEKSFDAWGRGRNPQNWVALPPVGTGNGWDRGYTGHEHLPELGIINMNGRLYDPLLGRMMEPDPFINGADNTQGYNRYTYAANNPLLYTDPDGHIWHIIIGGIVGGAVNLGVKVFQGKIHNWKDGAVAFGIGAVAGAVGAATGGAAFAAAGGGAAGAGGFVAGAAGGLFGSAAATPIQSMGNTIYFGDPALTSEGYVMNMLLGAGLGGITNGTIGLYNGRNFLTGELPKVHINTIPSMELQPVKLDEAKITNFNAQKINADIEGDFQKALVEWNKIRTQYGEGSITVGDVSRFNHDSFKRVLKDGSTVSARIYFGGRSNPTGYTIKVNILYPPGQGSFLKNPPRVYLRYK